MIALILNSGTGSRMGSLTENCPKCLVELTNGDTILSRQLRQLSEAGIPRVIITTGEYDALIRQKCTELNLPLTIEFVKNPCYSETNYIYSIYLARSYLQEDLILLHGDLVFADGLLECLLVTADDCMVADASLALPPKDFKAVISNGKIIKVGVEFFDNAVAVQPLYKLSQLVWKSWLDEIVMFCERGHTDCYAEKALNTIAHKLNIRPFYADGILCAEVDNESDLDNIKQRLEREKNDAKVL